MLTSQKWLADTLNVQNVPFTINDQWPFLRNDWPIFAPCPPTMQPTKRISAFSYYVPSVFQETTALHWVPKRALRQTQILNHHLKLWDLGPKLQRGAKMCNDGTSNDFHILRLRDNRNGSGTCKSIFSCEPSSVEAERQKFATRSTETLPSNACNKGTHESVPHFLGVSCAGGGITNMKKPETAMLSRNKARQPSALMSVSLIMVDKYIHRTWQIFSTSWKQDNCSTSTIFSGFPTQDLPAWHLHEPPDHTPLCVVRMHWSFDSIHVVEFCNIYKARC